MLGKKIGTTRVTLHSESKTQIGIFRYRGPMRLAAEIGNFSDGGIKVSSLINLKLEPQVSQSR